MTYESDTKQSSHWNMMLYNRADQDLNGMYLVVQESECSVHKIQCIFVVDNIE